MNFYTIISRTRGLFVGDVIEFENGVCVAKYEDLVYPIMFKSITEVIEKLDDHLTLVSDYINSVNCDYYEN
jgi:hypothetical protein